MRLTPVPCAGKSLAGLLISWSGWVLRVSCLLCIKFLQSKSALVQIEDPVAIFTHV